MAYLEKYKADEEIFNQVVPIDLGGVILSVVNPQNLEAEAAAYYVCSSSEEIKNRLPGAYVASLKDASEKLKNDIDRLLFRHGFLYGIRPKEVGLPIGYIMINTPVSSTGLNDWSLDFWMGEPFRGKRVMKPCLKSILIYLQRMQVPRVRAIVDRDNAFSIQILLGLNFTFEGVVPVADEDNNKRNIDLYCVNLKQ